MDISKAAGAAAANPAAEGSKAGGAAGAGAPERSFANVLGQGGGGVAPSHQQPPIQFSAPILEPGRDSRIKASGVTPHQQINEVGRRPTLELIGERGGTPPGPGGAPAVERPSPLQEMADNTMKAESRMDAMIQAARQGKSFSASELLALQVEVFRYSQTVEVISHSADKLVGAVKQTLGTQV